MEIINEIKKDLIISKEDYNNYFNKRNIITKEEYEEYLKQKFEKINTFLTP